MISRGPLTVGTILLATLAVGCGGNEDRPSADPTTSSPTPSPSPSQTAVTTSPSATPTTKDPGWADCARIWVVGKRLPIRYEGCDDAGKPVPANGKMCLVGHELVVFRNRYYAMATGKIFESGNLAGDPGYAQMQNLCKHGAPRN